MNISLESFFNKTYENKINESMMYYNYVFPEEEILMSINNLISIKIEDYINYIITNNAAIELTSKDIFQFSSLNDAIFKITNKIKENNDPGLTHLEIGKLLLDDGMERKYGAYLKYGENHSKTANELGLLYKSSNSYFLSCWGYIFNSLPKQTQDSFLLRLILRTNFIRFLIIQKDTNIYLRSICNFLSDSTYARRKPNMKEIIKKLENNEEFNFKFKNINY